MEKNSVGDIRQEILEIWKLQLCEEDVTVYWSISNSCTPLFTAVCC